MTHTRLLTPHTSPIARLSSLSAVHGSGPIAFESVNPYIACSGGNPSGGGHTHNGFCETRPALNMTQCNAFGIARNCATLNAECTALDHYPNASVAAYGTVPTSGSGYASEVDLMREIHDHGPISCGVDANWMLHYPDDCHSVSLRTKSPQHRTA